MVSCPRVCIFDIDNTITVGAKHDVATCKVVPGTNPAWPENSGSTRAIRDAVTACHQNGYKIAFATAESRNEADNIKQRHYLKSLDPTQGKLFTDEFFKSPAFQSAWNVIARANDTENVEFGHKESMYLSILKHYDVVPACFGSSIVFDDQAENLGAAHKLGLKTFQASTICGGFYCQEGCGISSDAVSLISRIANTYES